MNRRTFVKLLAAAAGAAVEGRNIVARQTGKLLLHHSDPVPGNLEVRVDLLESGFCGPEFWAAHTKPIVATYQGYEPVFVPLDRIVQGDEIRNLDDIVWPQNEGASAHTIIGVRIDGLPKVGRGLFRRFLSMEGQAWHIADQDQVWLRADTMDMMRWERA